MRCRDDRFFKLETNNILGKNALEKRFPSEKDCIDLQFIFLMMAGNGKTKFLNNVGALNF